MILFDTTLIPDDISNPCVVSGPNICVREEVYKTSLRLTKNRPHIITYQRCCRNASIDNLFIPDEQGSTITTTIPRFDVLDSNDTPVFNQFPPISICSGFDVNLDLSAIDKDGDSLVYSLCAPLNYSDRFDIRPIPANPPPYLPVPYIGSFTPSNPLPASPGLSVDPQTGRLSGVPTTIGQYVLAYCVEEYRNGQLINTTRRSIQVNTGNCNPVIVSAVQDQEQFCDGLTVQFRNRSSSNVTVQGYKWIFGDPTTLADTSRDFEPMYTYPDTGSYTITLISNPGLPCNDTSVSVFTVYKRLSPVLSIEGKPCIQGNRINFVARGDYEDYADFLWTFDGPASLPSSTLDSVPGVVYSSTGSFPVRLVVSQDGCSDTLDQQVEFFENPRASFDYAPEGGCYPLPVNFTNTSFAPAGSEFDWSFGDGATSTAFNPVHTYTANGYYNVRLEVRTTANCIDTAIFQIDSAVHVSLDSSKNEIKFGVSPSIACPGTSVQFIDSSFYEGGADYFWDFGNNQLSNDPSPSFTYQDTGYYSVGLLLITKDKCIDTLQLSLDSAIRILPQPNSVFAIDEPNKPIKEADFTFDARSSEGYTNSYFEINGQRIAEADFFEYTFQDTGHFVVSHIVDSEGGCSDTTEVDVFVFDEFEFIVPNVFTPNGDFVNDVFKVRACGVYEYEIQIFNRYGETVFSSNSMTLNWDGRINSRSVNAGTFFYKIRIKDYLGDYREYKGPLSLIRD